MTKIQFVLEGIGGELARSETITPRDDSDVHFELDNWLIANDIMLTAGDVIRIVEV
ncbi:MAG TPA: hypothetical protein VIV60_15300 [Polyangiaceae bacterium]